MKSPMIVVLTAVAAMAATPADAQRYGRHVTPQIGVPPLNNGPSPGPVVLSAPPPPPPPAVRAGGQHWGGQVNGRWIGGVQAPGGWNAYRRPARGFRLPSYWIAPSFFIGNFGYYGLATPPYGYRWSRYYDDAVLVDAGGRVFDWVIGVDWDAGVVRYTTQPGYGAPYPAPGPGHQYVDRQYQGGGAYAPPPVVVQAPPPGPVVQPLYPHGYTQTYSAGAGYYYPGGVTTTITVQSAPVVTSTTTTEYIEETVYRAPTVRRVYRKPVRTYRAKARPRCSCGCCR